MSSVATETQPSAAGVTRQSRLRLALRYRGAQLGVGIFALLLATAFIGPHFAPYSPTAVEGVPFAHPSSAHLFGLDYLGRDVLSRFLAGGASVFVLSFAATLLGYLVGIPVGLTAGYTRNWVDEVLMRGGDVVMAFPAIILVLVLVAGAGPAPGVIVIGVAVTHAPRIARIVRGATVEVVVQQYVEAAEARGETLPSILGREVLPNVSTTILADFGVRLTGSIILIASLSFLGFGIQPPASDWGLMINENSSGITLQPLAVAAPAVAIALLTIAVNLMGDGVSKSLGQRVDRRELHI